jgi:uroporphyrinogen decarboxylase
MLLPEAMGFDVKIVEGLGPVIEKNINTREDVMRIEDFDRKKIAFLQETIRILRGRLDVPVIGFSGAPFTLASYLIEGKPSRTWIKTKRFMLENPLAWHTLMHKLREGIVEYLRAQIDAGAQAVQLFDSWIGALSPSEYRTYVLPHVQYIFAKLKNAAVPRIHFGTDTAGILKYFSDVDCEVISVDWRIPLSDAKKIIGKKTLQGNLDPAMLLAPWKTLTREVDAMLTEINPKKGYIFNLGHGMLPEASDATIKKLVHYVHKK